MCFLFFFQAEDGIRDGHVTGVQTCALPIYEDEYLALINKPADMVVHPAKGHWSGTLVNALQFHFEELSHANGDYRPGIVHRLDRDTSGVILVAKEEQTHRELSLQFENRKIFKEYLAITAGVIDRDSD